MYECRTYYGVICIELLGDMKFASAVSGVGWDWGVTNDVHPKNLRASLFHIFTVVVIGTGLIENHRYILSPRT